MNARVDAARRMVEAHDAVERLADQLGGGDRTEGVKRIVRAAGLHLALSTSPAEAGILLREQAERAEAVKAVNPSLRPLT